MAATAELISPEAIFPEWTRKRRLINLAFESPIRALRHFLIQDKGVRRWIGSPGATPRRASASGHLDVLKRVLAPAPPDKIAKSFETRLALADLTGLAERNPAAVLSALDAGKLASLGLDKADMAKIRTVALTARDAAAATA